MHEFNNIKKHNQRLIMSRWIAVCSNRCLMFHYSGSSSIFLFVYGLMLSWGIISESRKKAKVFVIAPGSKHTVGRCWETISIPCAKTPQPSPCHGPGLGHHRGSPCQPSRLLMALKSRKWDYGTNALAASHNWHFPQGLGDWSCWSLGSWHNGQVWKRSKRLDGSKLEASGLLPINYSFQKPKTVHE